MACQDVYKVVNLLERYTNSKSWPNDLASKYVQQKLTELKGKID